MLTICVGEMFREVEFRRVLHDEHDRMLAHSSLRGLAMRPQNLLRGDGVVVKKPIRRERVAPPVARPDDTGLGVGRQRFHDQLAAPIQALVAQVDPL